MAKNTYQRQKDQKDQAKKRKKAEKLQRKHEKGAGGDDDVAYDEFAPVVDPAADGTAGGTADADESPADGRDAENASGDDNVKVTEQ